MNAVVAIIEQLAEVRNQTVSDTVEKLCLLLPAGLLRVTCDDTIQLYGATIISMLGTAPDGAQRRDLLSDTHFPI